MQTVHLTSDRLISGWVRSRRLANAQEAAQMTGLKPDQVYFQQAFSARLGRSSKAMSFDMRPDRQGRPDRQAHAFCGRVNRTLRGRPTSGPQSRCDESRHFDEGRLEA